MFDVQFSTDINKYRTDFVLQRFVNKWFVIITQYEKMVNVYSVQFDDLKRTCPLNATTAPSSQTCETCSKPPTEKSPTPPADATPSTSDTAPACPLSLAPKAEVKPQTSILSITELTPQAVSTPRTSEAEVTTQADSVFEKPLKSEEPSAPKRLVDSTTQTDTKTTAEKSSITEPNGNCALKKPEKPSIPVTINNKFGTDSDETRSAIQFLINNSNLGRAPTEIVISLGLKEINGAILRQIAQLLNEVIIIEVKKRNK